MDGVTSSKVLWVVGGILAAISQLQHLQATVCCFGFWKAGNFIQFGPVPSERGVDMKRFYSTWEYEAQCNSGQRASGRRMAALHASIFPVVFRVNGMEILAVSSADRKIIRRRPTRLIHHGAR